MNAEQVFTHHVQLILDNEEAFYNDMIGLAEQYPDDDETYELAGAIKEYVEELIPDEMYQYTNNPIVAELLTAALAYIDYNDLAHGYQTTVREG